MSEEVMKISEFDLTKQTVTLGSEDNPMWTIMEGHVDAVVFDKAWKEEGWDGGLDDAPTEEDIKNFSEGLEHGYGKLNEDETYSFRLTKDDEGAKPITIMMW